MSNNSVIISLISLTIGLSALSLIPNITHHVEGYFKDAEIERRQKIYNSYKTNKDIEELKRQNAELMEKVKSLTK